MATVLTVIIKIVMEIAIIKMAICNTLIKTTCKSSKRQLHSEHVKPPDQSRRCTCERASAASDDDVDDKNDDDGGGGGDENGD